MKNLVEINGEWTLSFRNEQQKLNNAADGSSLRFFELIIS